MNKYEKMISNFHHFQLLLLKKEVANKNCFYLFFQIFDTNL